WRKTCANSAGPSLQAQPAPCEKRVSRMAAMEMVDIASTEDTLSQSPGENGAGHHVTRRVHEADHELSFSLARGRREQLPPNRIRDEHTDQQEQQPPSPASQRVEPQRRQERDNQRL